MNQYQKIESINCNPYVGMDVFGSVAALHVLMESNKS